MHRYPLLRRALMVVVVPTLLATAACGGAGNDTASGDDGGGDGGDETTSVTISVTSEPDTLDAQLVNDRNARVFTSNIYESLLGRDAEGQVIPRLAETWEAEGESAWRFTLRDDVTFHDGSPFDAETVKFSIERMLDEEFDTQRTSYIEGITGAEAVDEYTLDILTDGTLATLPIQATQIPMVSPDTADTLDAEPVGTGPYQFVQWDRGSQMVAEKNPDYWGEEPEIDEFTVKIVPDNQTALAALQSGEVDLVIDILPEQRDLAPETISIPASEFSYVAFNTHLPALAPPEVRVAINMAIDKEALAETVYEGGYNPDLEPIPYDPEGARELLEEAGYDFSTVLQLNVPIARYLKGEETVEFLASQLADVGVQTEVIRTDFNQYREDGRIPGTEPGAMDLKYGWNSNEFADGSRILSHITCDGPSSKICIPEVDELMTTAAGTLDDEARAEAYQEVWAILRDDPYAIYLLQQNLLYGTSERLVWEPRPDDEYYVSEMAVEG
jgi:peptide/nickel transport system substrate-binding protein